jgi:uracil-DNA glycosylase
MNCEKCDLGKTKISIVNGRGSLPCDILFLADPPGHIEEATGRALAGDLGKVIDSLVKDADDSGELKHYIINVTKCRPTDSKGGINRDPKGEEIAACRDYVFDIYNQARPSLIVFVGKVAQLYYRSYFKSAITIPHPMHIIRSGGMRSPYYRETVVKLQRGIAR